MTRQISGVNGGGIEKERNRCDVCACECNLRGCERDVGYYTERTSVTKLGGVWSLLATFKSP